MGRIANFVRTNLIKNNHLEDANDKLDEFAVEVEAETISFLSTSYNRNIEDADFTEDDGQLTIDFYSSNTVDKYYPATADVMADGKVIAQDSTEYYLEAPDGEASQYTWNFTIRNSEVHLQCEPGVYASDMTFLGSYCWTNPYELDDIAEQTSSHEDESEISFWCMEDLAKHIATEGSQEVKDFIKTEAAKSGNKEFASKDEVDAIYQQLLDMDLELDDITSSGHTPTETSAGIDLEYNIDNN